MDLRNNIKNNNNGILYHYSKKILGDLIFCINCFKHQQEFENMFNGIKSNSN